MSVAFAVSDIIERVRVRADLPVFTSQTNITDATVLSMVQESARDLSALMAEQDWFFVTSTQLTTTPTVPYVSLPTGLGQLQRVAWLKDGTTDIPLVRATLEDTDQAPARTWDTLIPRYRLAGNLLELFPTPQAAYALDVRYSTGAFIATAADTLFGHLGWDTWIVYNICCIVRQRQEKDYSAFAGERSAKLEEIRATARRDRGGVSRPRNVRGQRGVLGMPQRWWKLP